MATAHIDRMHEDVDRAEARAVREELLALATRRAELAKPHPVGDPVRAFRQTLARARRVEAENRRLKARIREMEDQ